MSEMEFAETLLKKVPNYKLKYVITYLQGLTADEHDDELFCEKLYEEYLESENEYKNTEYSLDACKKEWGVE